MPTTRKRRSSSEDEGVEEPVKRQHVGAEAPDEEDGDSGIIEKDPTPTQQNEQAEEPTTSTAAPITDTSTASAAATDRLSRFKSLQSRLADSRKSNYAAVVRETKRSAAPTASIAGLERKHAKAAQELLKYETEAAGGDFERKRAWDWTAEESAAWDKRMAKKERHRQAVAFADYGSEARKTYKRQLREAAPPDLDEYAREKMAAVERAAKAGGLEIVEMEDGELVAVDLGGGGVMGDDSGPTDFVTDSKPSKERVDRLVAEMKRDEAAALKRRRDRGRGGDDGGDVTYINEKNKQFNEKLARFYNKYTVDIRESFERGTAI